VDSGRLVGTFGPHAIESRERNPWAHDDPVTGPVLETSVLDVAADVSEAASQPFVEPVGFILVHRSLPP
jgi:hypothetical protein